jgi:DNA-binding Lrp family transcriptional regulator
MANTDNDKQKPRGKRTRATKKPADILGDELNQKILDWARRHPQSNVATIAKAVGLERDTTQKRLNKLTALGALQRHYQVDLDALGFTNRYRMDIFVDPRELEKETSIKALGHRTIPNLQERLARKLLELNDKKGNENVIIEDVAVLMGDDADLCATVLTKGDQKAIYHFVTQVVRQELPGVRNSQTCIEAWSMSRDNAAKEAERVKQSSGQKTRKPATKRTGTRAAQKTPATPERAA